MVSKLDFISDVDLRNHVLDTITGYIENLQPYDLNKLNRNILDPIKLMFDKAVYGSTWEDVLNNEIVRQRDKSNNNSIGYFHQRIFKYIQNCEVPDNGVNGGWDVIVTPKNGYILSKTGNRVSRIFVEMKNKHNTMNSSSKSDIFNKMLGKIKEDDDCACFLVEVISKHSVDEIWCTSIKENGKNAKYNNERIRHVSIDKFYEIVTGRPNAFFDLCLALPEVIADVIKSQPKALALPIDTVYSDLCNIAKKIEKYSASGKGLDIGILLTGFPSYSGFSEINNVINSDKHSGNNDHGTPQE